MTEPTDRRARAIRAKHAGGRRKFGPVERAELLERVEHGATIAEAVTEMGFSRGTVGRHAPPGSDFRAQLDAALDIGERLRDRTLVFTETVRAQLVELVGVGRSVRHACAELGVDYGNVRGYIAAHEPFRLEVQGARVLALDRVESAAFDAATGKLPNVNARLVEYVLNNQRPRKWRTARLIGLAFAGGDGEAPARAPDIDLPVDDRDVTTRRLGDFVLANGPEAAAVGLVLARAFPEQDEADAG